MSAAYENPLIPNARLRQIYLAMLRARLLEKALPAARRGHAVANGSAGHAVGMAGLEACLVSTSVDLGPQDLVSDALAGGVVDFLRGAALGTVLRPGKLTPKRAPAKPDADCGAAAALPAAAGTAERLWAAMGAAAALQAAAAVAKIIAKADGGTAKPAGVAVVYLRSGEAPAALLRKVFTFAAERELPAIFVLLPPPRMRGGAAAKAGGASALALRSGVPGIAVDADDAVAIYRVAQESIGRARARGGAALIECIPFVLSGAAGQRKPAEDATDPIAGLEHYMLQRGVATRAWIEQAARSFARRLETAASR